MIIHYLSLTLRTVYVGRDSSGGIATCYGLDGTGIELRWWVRFSAAVETALGAHPPSCTMGTGSLSRGKSGRCVALTAHPCLAPGLKKE